eukprot:1160365-Pelagomonas_calceolata.AAC.8
MPAHWIVRPSLWHHPRSSFLGAFNDCTAALQTACHCTPHTGHARHSKQRKSEPKEASYSERNASRSKMRAMHAGAQCKQQHRNAFRSTV